MKISDVLTSKVACVVISGDEFNKKIIDLLKVIKNKNVCYVTLNKSADAAIEYFKKNKINTENFYFIDCVSKTITTPKAMPNCTFVSSPDALTELSLAIKKSVNSGYRIVVIDSVTTLMVYHKASVLERFFYDTSNVIRSKGENLILTIASEDKRSDVFKNVEIIVDDIIELK